MSESPSGAHSGEKALDQELILAARAQVEQVLDSSERVQPFLTSDDPMAAMERLDLRSGSFPGYQIVREIHRGGQGVVYEAIQLSTKRTVAIKVLLEGPFADERARWRFEREVKLIAALRHPNIVALHDSGVVYGRYYFAMDYVHGEPLDSYVGRTAASLRQVIGLFAQVLQGVAHAHRHGVIHRDLKPSNILVGEDGIPLVLDFGLAKIVGDELKDSQPGLLSMPGNIIGTLRYMSPEQTLGNPDDIDVRADVYALGVILYELLTGQPPYPTGRDLAEAFKNIREADPVKPTKLRREIHGELESVILKALAKEPERRYQSAGELAADLMAWLESRPVSAKSDSSLYVMRKLATRYYFHTAAIAALVLAIVGFGGVSFHFLRQTRAALHEQQVSEANARVAWKDMDQFFADAQDAARQRALGWFLSEWQAGRVGRARKIQEQVQQSRPDAPENAAMAFLLDEAMTIERLAAQLSPGHDVLLHLIAGERLAKAGRLEEAGREFAASVAAGKGPECYRMAAEARLQQLQGSAPPATRPAGVEGREP